MPTENFILNLISLVGSIEAVFVILALLFGVSLIQILTWWLKHRVENKNTKRIIEEVDNIYSAQESIISNLNMIVNVVGTISSKLKNVISEKDSLNILKTTSIYSLLTNFIDKSVYFSNQLENSYNGDIESQIELELKNVWNGFIEKLDSFNSPIKMGQFVSDNYSNIVCYNDSCLLDKIKIVIMNQKIGYYVKRERIKALIEDLFQNILHDLKNEYESLKKMKG